MKVLLGYFAVTFLDDSSVQESNTGFTASQNLLSLLQGPQRRLQIRSNGIFDLARLIQRHDPVPSSQARSHASASASSSVGLAGGLAGIHLNDLLGGTSLFSGHVGIQPPALPRIATRRQNAIVRPRSSILLGQGIQTLPVGGVALPSHIGAPRSSSRLGTTMMFDTPDQNTPDQPDLVYAPRNMMGNMQQIEALRNQYEADGVVFV